MATSRSSISDPTQQHSSMVRGIRRVRTTILRRGMLILANRGLITNLILSQERTKSTETHHRTKINWVVVRSNTLKETTRSKIWLEANSCKMPLIWNRIRISRILSSFRLLIDLKCRPISKMCLLVDTLINNSRNNLILFFEITDALSLNLNLNYSTLFRICSPAMTTDTKTSRKC